MREAKVDNTPAPSAPKRIADSRLRRPESKHTRKLKAVGKVHERLAPLALQMREAKVDNTPAPSAPERVKTRKCIRDSRLRRWES
uniref:Uncharacterized protein n=1 Tax=Ascaris lumbricoides TaxID=6252 RepID=A0A0M3HPZ5_ASCLU